MNIAADYVVEEREFWTSKQKQSNSLHEISYRACFKPELPRFFIENYTNQGDVIYDPFAGRGTTCVESVLLGRVAVSNDINPLSEILCRPRVNIPTIKEIEKRLHSIPIIDDICAEMDLSMFYHADTLKEILSIRKYLLNKEKDYVDDFIQMILTNRLTGHSKGFLSTYTLPPNQAVSPERQRIINERYNNDISYKNAKEIILDKSKKLLRHLDMYSLFNIKNVRDKCLFTTEDAEDNSRVQDDSVALTVTSPPFLDVVRYDQDNWLRCYINNIDLSMINMSMIKSVQEWDAKMFRVLKDLHRVTKRGGHVAFEVGEVRSGTVKLEESIVENARKIGFKIEKIMINKQSFTKTSNIWGIKNNTRGTNTNRIVLLKKV